MNKRRDLSRDEWLALWTELYELHLFHVHLEGWYDDRMLPHEGYRITVPAFGRMNAHEITTLQRVAARHGCDVHFIQASFYVLPTTESPPDVAA